MSGNGPRKITDFWRSQDVGSIHRPGLFDRPAHINIGGTKRRKLSPSSKELDHAPTTIVDLTDKDEALSQTTSQSSANLTTPPDSPSHRSSPLTAIETSAHHRHATCDVLPSLSSAGPSLFNPSTSFTSLPPSTLPSSTQSKSSRRTTTSEGKVIVKDSSSDDDTDSSLERFVSSFEQSRVNQSKPKSPQVVIKRSPIQRTTINPLPARNPAGKAKSRATMSFAALIADAQQGSEADARFREQRSENHSALRNRQSSDESLDFGIPTAQFGGHEDGEVSTDRVRRAVEKTEALHTDQVWHMFSKMESQPVRSAFPAACLPLSLQNLKEKKLRKSPKEWDLLVDLCSIVKLPRSLMTWLSIEICHETSDELVERYVRCIVANATSAEFDANMLEQMLSRLGVAEKTFEPGYQLQLVRQEGSQDETLTTDVRRKLRRIVDLLGRIGSGLKSDERSKTLHYLLLMRLDHVVSQDSLLTTRVEDAIESICRTLTDEETAVVLTYLKERFQQSIIPAPLQLALLSAIRPLSPQLHHLRRHLAFGFGFGLDAQNRKFSSQGTADLAIQCLGRSEFRTGRNVDYASLAVRLSCVDIAIDCGFANLMFALNSHAKTSAARSPERHGITHGKPSETRSDGLSPGSLEIRRGQLISESSDLAVSCNAQIANEMHLMEINRSNSMLNTTVIARPRKSGGPTETEQQRRRAENEFNKQLKQFVDQLRTIAGQIQITGATNLKGTEAQGVANLAAIRLEGLMTRNVDTMDIFDKCTKQSDLTTFLLDR